MSSGLRRSSGSQKRHWHSARKARKEHSAAVILWSPREKLGPATPMPVVSVKVKAFSSKGFVCLLSSPHRIEINPRSINLNTFTARVPTCGCFVSTSTALFNPCSESNSRQQIPCSVSAARRSSAGVHEAGHVSLAPFPRAPELGAWLNKWSTLWWRPRTPSIQHRQRATSSVGG